MIDEITKTLAKINAHKPVILNLTNHVTMDFVANCLLAIGASPIMSSCKTETQELVNICSAVYINIGTLNPNFLEQVDFALDANQDKNAKIILDPVGAGASKLRTQASKNIANSADIIRGNASEVLALNSLQEMLSKGVESYHNTDDAINAAKHLARAHHSTITISGATDYITDGNKEAFINFGSPIMQRVTGMGCSLTAVIAAFATVSDNDYNACIQACSFFALCGQMVALNNTSPGSFKTAFIDQLYQPNFELMQELYAS
jgi:hydroxyethylthiazole kinase